jgi:two-component system nitrogen regulation response regulator NtrX
VFERAHGGTLYLDEVADMPRETQSRILRVLVEQRFRRVGGDADVQVDVRVISSTSRELREEIAAGRFREDLFHRLNVVPVRVPGLSERREDIPELISYFIERIAEATGMPRRRLGEDALATLQVHEWPGNVRQLRNNVERLLILASGDPADIITADMLPSEVSSAGGRRGRSPPNGSSPCRCARRASCSSANISTLRYCGSAEISRARPPSLAWSARPCTAS